MAKVIGIIPARMSSTRFPGKPLAKIQGIPMIGHVYFGSKKSKSLAEVYVATCDQKIFDYIESIGGKAVMTAKSHERATDRTAECLLKIEKQTGDKIDFVVMIQGDEPMIVPQMIDEAVQPLLEDDNILVSNLVAPLLIRDEQNDPNEVKVVIDQQGYALYFSREPIPSWEKGGTNILMLKQVCIIPFRRDFLIKFNQLTQTPLEIAESIDMLRILEHGYKVKTILSKHKTYSVDTPEDLSRVEKLWKTQNSHA
ncbi:MAG: 3-deoxy-manno-octulosonate cytidylyltransferase [Candidatus Vogelbacteria bacterium]|nr:3-deoxy-manno-octulosonate cytidylyltransferase [Candidatus Vogelbacteria bacterium]